MVGVSEESLNKAGGHLGEDQREEKEPVTCRWGGGGEGCRVVGTASAKVLAWK